MREQVTSPSKITAWLDCPHYLTLRSQVESGRILEPNKIFGSFSRLLQAKGELHETACLKEYERLQLSVYRVPVRQEMENFTEWIARVGNPLTKGYDVIYQMPFIHNGVRGSANPNN